MFGASVGQTAGHVVRSPFNRKGCAPQVVCAVQRCWAMLQAWGSHVHRMCCKLGLHSGVSSTVSPDTLLNPVMTTAGSRHQIIIKETYHNRKFESTVMKRVLHAFGNKLPSYRIHHFMMTPFYDDNVFLVAAVVVHVVV